MPLRIRGKVQNKQLTFDFLYIENNEYEHLPESMNIIPDPHIMTDDLVLLVIASMIRVLTNRHGLEKALELANDAGYGKLDDTGFALKWDIVLKD